MKKGFTLVELLAVIVILSLLALLTSTAITKLLSDAKGDLSNIQKNSIKSAAETWIAANMSQLPKDGECKYLTLKDLKDSGLLDKNVIDSNTSKNISDDLKVKITSNKGEQGNLITKYEVEPESITGCTSANPYKDSTGANVPDLMGGTLTPITYKTDHWEVADTTQEWYNYDKKEWANAVILNDTSKSKANPGTTIDVETDVLAMFVWIPRYSYTISSTAGNNKNSPGLIDIKFVDRYEKEKGTAIYTGDTGDTWYTHPAFNFGGEQLSGIWVGKFEISHTEGGTKNLNCTNENCEEADKIRILPNVVALRYNDISNFFYVIRSMSRTNNSFGLKNDITDTHMMKNSEWGAVAYLSHSKYGKDNEEVYINNCSNYITGIGASTASAESNASCTNTYSTEIGQKASTTGNIYGVYDMSGGSFEYVMGVYKEKIGQSGFIDNLEGIDEKYFDNYTTDTASDESYKGHALGETSGWYGDVANYVSNICPWFKRGHANKGVTNAGVFSFDLSGGAKDANNGADSFNSARVILSPL